MIKPRIIERDGKPKYAVIPITEWRKIQAMVEELEEIRDFDAALARPNRRMVPFEVTSAILDGASPIRAWREYRGLNQTQLAAAAGIHVDELSELEDGTRRPSVATLRKIAKVLQTHLDDLRG